MYADRNILLRNGRILVEDGSVGSKETDEVAAAGRQSELYPPPVDYPTIRSARGGGGWGGLGVSGLTSLASITRLVSS